MLGTSVPRFFTDRLPQQAGIRILTAILFLVFALGTFGCSNSMPSFASEHTSKLLRASTWQHERRSEPQIQVRITPGDITLQSGQQMRFRAVVNATLNMPVRWTTTAGNISDDGLFTAPSVLRTQPVVISAAGLFLPDIHASTTVIVSPATGGHPPAMTITTPDLPSATIGLPYTASLSVSGGTLPYAWRMAAGVLPNGISLASNTGIISGSTAQQGTFSVAIKVTDAAGATATQSFRLAVASNNPGACGPPTYPCSRTDLQITPLPNPIPNVGNLTGANTVITDPDFHNPIARLTDADTNPNAKNVTFVASSGGSSNANTWNTDSSLIFVQDTNATGYPMTFNATALQATRMYVASFPQTGGMTIPNNHFSWSRVNPNYLYALGGTRILLYDFTNRDVPPSPRLIYDFTASPNCLPAGFTPAWQNFGGVSAGDTAFAVGVSNDGFQGTGTYVLVYTVGKGCSLLNTRTGRITSDWGQTGTITTPDRFTLHDAFLTMDSGWAILGSTTCLSSTCAKGPYFWQVGTTNITACGAAQHGLCSGHWTLGHSHWANNDGDPFGQFHLRRFSDLASFTPLINILPPGFAPPVDQHPSWNNVDPNDTVPFISSSWTRISPFTTAWQNEIMAFSITTGTVSRFAHNFVTADSHRFVDKEAIGQVSQDGRFFMFNSDWMGTLGSESGSSTCTIGSDCRGDVFVVQLN
jgi:hypothetical protein